MENCKFTTSRSVKRYKFLFVLAIFLSSFLSVYAEDVSNYVEEKTFTFSFENVPLKQVLSHIEKNSEFIFVYYGETINPNRKVSIKVTNQPIRPVLDKLFKGMSVEYTIDNKQITLKKVAQKKVQPQSSKRKTIQGFVLDKDEQPITGATIKIKDSTTGALTDIEGFYKLELEEENPVLIVSFMGYITQEVKVGKKSILNIQLEEDTKALDEVVVTAFGIGQKKESLVGAIQQIRPEQLRVPSSRLSSSFAGRLSGVIAVQRSGEPGADGASFWIRGASTFSGATDPLIILDGVEIDATQLNNLDPEVIESFSILKDATATALYGTRGANGVMVVTTKNGENLKKPIINFRVEGAISQLTNVPKMVDGITYMRLYNEAQTRTPETTDIYSDEKINATIDGVNPYMYPNIDWYNEMFKKNTFAERFNFNIRGGSSRVDYFMSASVKHSDGNLKSLSKDFYSFNNNINVYNYDFVNNLNIKATNTTKISLGLNVSVRDWSGPYSSAGSVFSSALNANPVDFPIRFPGQEDDTHIRWGGRSGAPNGSYVNPVADFVSGYSSTYSTSVTANLRFNQDLKMIMKGLKLNAIVSYYNYSYSKVYRYCNVNQYETSMYNPQEDTYDLNIIGNEQSTELKTGGSNSGNRRLYLQASLDYNRTFNDVHKVNVMFLYNQEQNDVNNPSDLLTSLPRRKQGIAGRLSYGFAGRYLAELNFGYNGSENFPKNKKFGFFPSVAIGYNLSEEKFWEPLRNIIPQFKIRASWGLVGNDQTGAGRFTFLENLTNSGAGFTTGTGNQTHTNSGPVWKRYANPNLTWEVGEKWNAGIDVRILKGFSFSADIFKEVRKEIFMDRGTIPTLMGLGNVTVQGNLGKMRNWGIDTSVDYNNQINKDLFVSFKGTFTFAHNKILEMDEPEFSLYPNRLKVGHSLNTIFGYVADGLFTDENMINNSLPQQFANLPLMPGDIKYKDIPNALGGTDNAINEYDKVALGYPSVPEIVYGFGPSIKYKNLDFSLFFQGTGRVSLMMSGFHPFTNDNNTAKRGILDYVADGCWTTDNPNPNASYPRLTTAYNTNNNQNSTFWLRNAAFLKLKNAEIGYSFKNMRIYVSGNNLLTFSKFKLWDPEMGGGSGMSYPTQRTFNVGFQMTIN